MSHRRQTLLARLRREQGNSEFLATHALGTQGYVCLPSGSGVSFTVNNARPEATLFGNVFGEAFQVITHFLSPVQNPNDVGPKPPRFGDATWQSSFDSSKVWAQKTNFITAGTDDSCPNSGAIDCLLLQTIGTAQGPTGGRTLTRTTFIQRLNTKGDPLQLPGAPPSPMSVNRPWCRTLPTIISSGRTNSPRLFPSRKVGLCTRSRTKVGALRVRSLNSP